MARKMTDDDITLPFYIVFILWIKLFLCFFRLVISIKRNALKNTFNIIKIFIFLVFKLNMLVFTVRFRVKQIFEVALHGPPDFHFLQISSFLTSL